MPGVGGEPLWGQAPSFGGRRGQSAQMKGRIRDGRKVLQGLGEEKGWEGSRQPQDGGELEGAGRACRHGTLPWTSLLSSWMSGIWEMVVVIEAKGAFLYQG